MHPKDRRGHEQAGCSPGWVRVEFRLKERGWSLGAQDRVPWRLGPRSRHTHKAPVVSEVAAAPHRAPLGRQRRAQSRRGQTSPPGPAVGLDQLCREGVQASQSPEPADPQPGEARTPDGEARDRGDGQGDCISQQHCPPGIPQLFGLWACTHFLHSAVN